MTTFIIIEESRANIADGTPTGCGLCGATTGPFVLVDQIAQNPQGAMKLDRQLQVCAPKLEGETVLRQGCAGTLATLVGYVGTEQLGAAQQSIRDANDRAVELEAEVQRLTKSQVNVVSVDDLMKLIEVAKPAAPAV